MGIMDPFIYSSSVNSIESSLFSWPSVWVLQRSTARGDKAGISSLSPIFIPNKRRTPAIVKEHVALVNSSIETNVRDSPTTCLQLFRIRCDSLHTQTSPSGGCLVFVWLLRCVRAQVMGNNSKVHKGRVGGETNESQSAVTDRNNCGNWVLAFKARNWPGTRCNGLMVTSCGGVFVSLGIFVKLWKSLFIYRTRFIQPSVLFNYSILFCVDSECLTVCPYGQR